jgi:hypothetical protein
VDRGRHQVYILECFKPFSRVIASNKEEEYMAMTKKTGEKKTGVKVLSKATTKKKIAMATCCKGTPTSPR